mmetsp:Transcript_15910/g.32157  ORF Transcript_15910/g.32157 Transcript_15910/m.32157 type:complete len:230 (+) Transcript_15910:201-890(+)
MQPVPLEPLLRLERIVEALEEVGVVHRVGNTLGCLGVGLTQLVAPQLHHLRLAAWQVGTRHEGCLRGTPRAEQQLKTALGVAAQEGAQEGDVQLALLARELAELLDALSMSGRRVEQQQSGHVGGAYQALLGEDEIARDQCEIAELLPLGLGRVRHRDVIGRLQLLQLDGQLELMLGVGGDGECLLLEALCLEEARDAVVLLLRYRRQYLRRRLEVTPHHGGLVLEHRE